MLLLVLLMLLLLLVVCLRLICRRTRRFVEGVGWSRRKDGIRRIVGRDGVAGGLLLWHLSLGIV